MSIGIGENLGKSFGFAKDSLVGKWLNWLLLIVVTYIPIVNFIGTGTYLKIYRGKDPAVEGIGKSFIDGLLYFIIVFLYILIPMIITAILTALIGEIGGIIGAVLMLIFLLLALPAGYNFAKKGFGAAFAFGELFKMIGKVGWLKYILNMLVLYIVVCVVAFVLGIIPILGWLLMIILGPALNIFTYKFVANLLA